MAELRKKSSRRRSSCPAPVAVHNVTCAALGDGDIGKSSMLLTFLSGHFPEQCSPGPMDGLSEYDHLISKPTSIKQENIEVKITLVDTYGQDEYDKLRERVCASAHVYLLCYDVTRPLSLARIQHHWVPEFRKYKAADSAFLLVGLKTDLRTRALAEGSDGSEFVTSTQGLRMAEELGANHFVECSARNNVGVKRVFEKAAHAAIQAQLPADLKRSSCVVS